MKVFLALLGVLSAFASPGPRGNWCEDLAGDCRGSPEVVLGLSSVDPREFLPPELADYVAKCATARSSGDSKTLAELHASNPLKDVLNQVLMIGKDERAKAQLPKSGGRFVIGCTTPERHVQRSMQLRADLPEKRQRALLKKLFTNLYVAHLDPQFQAIRGRSSPGEIVVPVCDLGKEVPLPARKKCASSIWTFVNGGVVRAQDVPESYVEGCIPIKTVREGNFSNAPEPPKRSDETIQFEKELNSHPLSYSAKAMGFDTEGCGKICRGSMRSASEGAAPAYFVDVFCKANRDGSCPDAKTCLNDNDMDYVTCSNHPKEQVHECSFSDAGSRAPKSVATQKCGRICKALIDCRVNGAYGMSKSAQCPALNDGSCPDADTCIDDHSIGEDDVCL